MLLDCCFGRQFQSGSVVSIMNKCKSFEYTSKLRKQIQNLVDSPMSPSKRISLLESMENELSCSIFGRTCMND